MKQLLSKSTSIAPLVSFRVLFGLLGFGGLLWSLLKGDIEARFWAAQFFFKYEGWEWLPYIGDSGILGCYILGMLGALGIALGFYYRISVLLFALCFSYLHSVDASNYINHYYLIWIFSVYLFLVPAHAACSLDAKQGRVALHTQVPYWTIALFQFQLLLVYSYAGLAKLNPDWILEAMPLKIWLLQQQDFPILGPLFALNWVHFAFSWLGAFFDLTIVWFLVWKKTRPFAYGAVLFFHGLTWLLFDIGLFPPLMICATLVFFSGVWHQAIWQKLGFYFSNSNSKSAYQLPKLATIFLQLFLLIQVFLPLRSYLLPYRTTIWTDYAYRYAWRVMLSEKEGIASFVVEDKSKGGIWLVDNEAFLTGFQIKQMSVRPEHIRQFAHFLAKEYGQRYQISQPFVRADVFVAMNGRVSKRLIDPSVNLAAQPASWGKRTWVLE